MKKRILFSIIAVLLLITISGCGMDSTDQYDDDDNGNQYEEDSSSYIDDTLSDSNDDEQEQKGNIQAKKHDIGENWGSENLDIVVTKAYFTEPIENVNLSDSTKETHKILAVEFTIKNNSEIAAFTQTRPWYNMFKMYDKDLNAVYYAVVNNNVTGFDSNADIGQGETKSYSLYFEVEKSASLSDFYFAIYPDHVGMYGDSETGGQVMNVRTLGIVIEYAEWHYVQLSE